jgi:hypothetical protein
MLRPFVSPSTHFAFYDPKYARDVARVAPKQIRLGLQLFKNKIRVWVICIGNEIKKLKDMLMWHSYPPSPWEWDLVAEGSQQLRDKEEARARWPPHIQLQGLSQPS